MSRVLPILFNEDMVLAILDGRKTTTRRLIKPQPKEDMKYKLGYLVMGGAKKDIGKFGFGTREWGGRTLYARPPAQVGDILYVRETWNTKCANCEIECPAMCSAPKYVYRADYGETEDKWRPSIHMPKDAARIWLKVTDVQVEKLQHIPKDIWTKEGIYNNRECYGWTWKANPKKEECYPSPGAAFKELWNSTVHKKELYLYGWRANPWVWVIEFERCEKPEPWRFDYERDNRAESGV